MISYALILISMACFGFSIFGKEPSPTAIVIGFFLLALSAHLR